MVYAIILAAGIGARFKKTPIKPLYVINKKPLFLHSVDTFLACKKIDKILLVINDKYKKRFQKYLSIPKYKNILICNGNQSARWKSLINGVNYLQTTLSLNENDILITHDAARINVTSKIIIDNIQTTHKYGYASTVLALHDSIFQLNGEVSYLDRSHKYVVQTPQTIQYKFWKESEIKDDHAITDLFTYLQLKLKKENLVNGNLLNYKITTVADLKLI